MRKKTLMIILFLCFINGCSTYTGYTTSSTGFDSKDYKCPDCNIVLITVDALRADHLSCYGYHRDTAPTICDFAKENVLFEDAFVQLPLTGPSHASILSSRYPDSHGLLKHESILNENITFMSQLLRKNGYYTGAFVNVLTLDSRFGFGRGFDTFFYNKSYNAQETNKFVFEWLENNKNKKFFLWVHYFDPHFTYDPPYPYDEAYSKNKTKFDSYNNWNYLDKVTLFRNLFKNGNLAREDLTRAISLYDGEIKFVDDRLKELLNYLKINGVYDNSMIIITSDHGEGFDHGYYFNHPMFIYDSLIHVPLIIKFPYSHYKDTRVDSIVESVDIAPTILDCLNIEIPAYFEGISLLDPIANNKEPKRFAISQTFLCHRINDKCFPKGYSAISKSIRSKEWKFIRNPYNGSFNYELYDLESDHDEMFNVYGEYPELVNKFEEILSNITNPEPVYKDSTELDQETINELKALGYMN